MRRLAQADNAAAKESLVKDWNWKFFGQLFSAQNQLFSLIRGILEPMQIGAEIIPWILEEGKETFAASLRELGKKFLNRDRVRVIDENTIMVNLDAPLLLPFEGAKVEPKRGKVSTKLGWVRVEKRDGVVYVADHKLDLYRSSRQQGNESVIGHDLRKELDNQWVPHLNIMDALAEYNLFQEEWKQDEDGRTLYIFFWDEIFSDSNGDLYVRCVYWRGGQWFVGCSYLGSGWGVNSPAAVSAS